MRVRSDVSAAEETWQQPSQLPALTGDAIHVWRLRRTERVANEDYLAYLEPEESARASRLLFPADREQSIASRGTLRLLLAHYTGAARPCDLRFALGEHGKPYLADSDLRFNLSHTRDLALFAFARDIDLGIDLEQIRPAVDLDAVAEQNFAPSEREALLALPQTERTRAFYRCWTRKEALLKAEGTGLFRALDTFAVSLLPGEPARVIAGAAGWELQHIDVAPNAVGAIAWEHRPPPPGITFLDCSPSLFGART